MHKMAPCLADICVASIEQTFIDNTNETIALFAVQRLNLFYLDSLKQRT